MSLLFNAEQQDLICSHSSFSSLCFTTADSFLVTLLALLNIINGWKIEQVKREKGLKKSYKVKERQRYSGIAHKEVKTTMCLLNNSLVLKQAGPRHTQRDTHTHTLLDAHSKL